MIVDSFKIDSDSDVTELLRRTFPFSLVTTHQCDDGKWLSVAQQPSGNFIASGGAEDAHGARMALVHTLVMRLGVR